VPIPWGFVNKQFYEALLPPEGDGLYCAVSLLRGGGAAHTYHNTIEDLEERAHRLAGEKQDAYFALATFKDRRRAADNVQSLKCFFLDIDCGEGKPYMDQTAGAQALSEFIDTVGLPKPFVVNSGRGLHVYWPFEQAVSRDVWLPHARSLKRLCVEHKLHADPAVPADAARILRMPDTYNTKADPPLQVQIIIDGEVAPNEKLFALLPVGAELSSFTVRQFDDDGMTRSLANIDALPVSMFSRIARKSLAGKEGCKQIRHAVLDASTLEEPLWRAALSIAWRCKDGEQAIHKISRAYPQYTPEATLAKAQATVGPMTCEWYKANYPEHCTGCPHTITSPILLGRMVEEAPVVDGQYVATGSIAPENAPIEEQVTTQIKIPLYPFPYFRGANGGVYKKDKDKDNEPIEVEVYKYDLYVTERFYDADEEGEGLGEMVRICIHTPRDGIRSIISPISELLVLEKLRDILLKHGVVAFKDQMGLIMAYIASSIRNLQRMAPADRTRNQMGWTPDNTGFVVGDIEYTRNGLQLAPAGPASKNFVPAFRAKGSLDKWSAIANFYNRPDMEGHALALFFGMGAPLLRLVGNGDVRGATINLMSNKSGTGKTTVLRVINSLFGHPDHLLLQQSDTINSKMQVLGVFNTIATTMDEITNIGDEALSQLIYDIPQGRGKHRMEAQTNKLRTNTITWTTFAITTSNSSIYDKLRRLKNMPDGELRRVIELTILRPMDIEKYDSDRVFGALAENHGLAGPVFIQYVLKNIDSVIEQVKTVQRHIDEVFKLTQSDRFFSLQFACAFAAAGIYRALGLMDIDTKRVFRYAVGVVREVQNNILAPMNEPNAVITDALYTFITDNIHSTLVINGEQKGVLTAAIHVPKTSITMRYEPDTKELWIPVGVLRKYLTDKQVDYRASMKTSKAAGILKHDGEATNKRLAAGAIPGFNAAPVRCICIDAPRLGIEINPLQDESAEQPAGENAQA
jgi:hypothetical protein